MADAVCVVSKVRMQRKATSLSPLRPPSVVDSRVLCRVQLSAHWNRIDDYRVEAQCK